MLKDREIEAKRLQDKHAEVEFKIQRQKLEIEMQRKKKLREEKKKKQQRNALLLDPSTCCFGVCRDHEK